MAPIYQASQADETRHQAFSVAKTKRQRGKKNIIEAHFDNLMLLVTIRTTQEKKHLMPNRNYFKWVQEDIRSHLYQMLGLKHPCHISPLCICVSTFYKMTRYFCHILTLSDAGQNRTSVDVKFTPLEWNLALYSWQRRVFPAELHQLCVNNQGLTCGVKPCNWSDTSKRWLAPSLGGKTLHGASKADRGGRFTHTHIHKHTQTHTGQEKEVMGCPDWMTLWECLFCHTSAFSVSLSLPSLVNEWLKCSL